MSQFEKGGCSTYLEWRRIILIHVIATVGHKPTSLRLDSGDKTSKEVDLGTQLEVLPNLQELLTIDGWQLNCV